MKFNKLCKTMTLKDYLIAALCLALLYLIMNKLLNYLNNRENFQDTNTAVPEGNDINMALFYADWCPHCQKVKPLWRKLTKKMNNKEVNGKTVHIIMVHCPDKEEVCKANDISVYPTIKCISKNKSQEYDGERTLNGLTDFINEFASSL